MGKGGPAWCPVTTLHLPVTFLEGPETARFWGASASPFSLGTAGLVQLTRLKGQNPGGKQTLGLKIQREKMPLPRKTHGSESGQEKGQQEIDRLSLLA